MRGTAVVGGAWKNMDDNGHEIPPQPCAPEIEFKVGYAHLKGPYYGLAVTQEEMEELRSTRDYIISCLPLP